MQIIRTNQPESMKSAETWPIVPEHPRYNWETWNVAT